MEKIYVLMKRYKRPDANIFKFDYVVGNDKGTVTADTFTADLFEGRSVVGYDILPLMSVIPFDFKDTMVYDIAIMAHLVYSSMDPREFDNENLLFGDSHIKIDLSLNSVLRINNIKGKGVELLPKLMTTLTKQLSKEDKNIFGIEARALYGISVAQKNMLKFDTEMAEHEHTKSIIKVKELYEKLYLNLKGEDGFDEYVKKLYEKRELNINCPYHSKMINIFSQSFADFISGVFQYSQFKSTTRMNCEKMLKDFTELGYDDDDVELASLVKDIHAMTRHIQKLNVYINNNTHPVSRYYNIGAITGRMSSRKFSSGELQGVSIQGTTKRMGFRNFFKASDGKCLVSADFKALEARITAIMSADDEYIDLFSTDIDVHSLMACKLFKLEYNTFIDILEDEENDQHKEHFHMRNLAKAVGHAVNFGGTAHTISKNSGISLEEAQEIYDNYFDIFCKLKKYREESEIKERVTTKLGRDIISYKVYTIQHVNNIGSYMKESCDFDKTRNFYVAKGNTTAVSRIIQATGNEVFKNAISKLTDLEDYRTDEAVIRLLAHDSIIIEIDDDDVLKDKWVKLLAEVMQEAGDEIMDHKVKMLCDAKIGYSWGGLL